MRDIKCYKRPGTGAIVKAFAALTEMGWWAKAPAECCKGCSWSSVPKRAMKKGQVAFLTEQDVESFQHTGTAYVNWKAPNDDPADLLEVFKNFNLHPEWEGEPEKCIRIVAHNIWVDNTAEWTKATWTHEVKFGEICCVKDISMLVVCQKVRGGFRRLFAYDTVARASMTDEDVRLGVMQRPRMEGLIGIQTCRRFKMPVQPKKLLQSVQNIAYREKWQR